MLTREQLCGYHGLILPAILHGGASYPPLAREIPAVALRDVVNIRMAQGSSTAEELSRRISEWVPRVATAIDMAPPWDPNWSQLDISATLEPFSLAPEPTLPKPGGF